MVASDGVERLGFCNVAADEGECACDGLLIATAPAVLRDRFCSADVL